MSIFTLRIFQATNVVLYCHLVLSVVHIVTLWINHIVEDEARKLEVLTVLVFLLGVLHQIRGFLLSIVVFNVLFEFITLLYIILSEQNKSMEEILFLKKMADSQMKEKRKMICQEKTIKYVMWFFLFSIFVTRLFGILPKTSSFAVYAGFDLLKTCHINKDI